MAALAWLLDSSIPVPGTRHRFGIGPLIGLVPVVGDVVGGVAGVYLILRSLQVGLPRIVIVRMAINVLVDTAIGFIPVLGDAFDFFYKSNLRNLRLFEQHALDPRSSTRGSWAFVGLLVLVVIGVLVLLGVVVVAILEAIVAAF